MYSILHIDDNESDFEILSYKLRKLQQDLEIDWVNSINQAKQAIEQKQYNCIICDYQMPGGDGLMLLKQLRAENNAIPFVFLTGQGNERLAAEALRAGADEYYTKDETLAHYPRLLHSIGRLIAAYEDRRQKQAAKNDLQRNEKLYRALFENANDPIFIVDVQGRILEVNTRASELLDYSNEQLCSMHVFDLQESVDAENFSEKADLIQKKGSLVYETLLSRRSGQPVHVEISACSIEYLDNPALLEIVRDISLRKKQELELQVKGAALDASHTGVAIADDSGIVTYVNNAAQHMWGYDSAEDFIGRHMFSFWAREFGKRERRLIDRKLETTGAWRTVADAVHADGSTFPVLLTLNTVSNPENNSRHYMIACTDLTEQLERERDLQIKNFAVESSRTAIAFSDTLGVISYVNNALLELWGYGGEADKVLGRNTRHFFAKPKGVVPLFQGLREKGQWRGLLEAVHRDGRVFRVRATASTVLDETGSVICWMCTFIDVTENVREREQLQEKETHLRTIFDNAACGIGFVDADANFIEVNHQYAALAGYSVDEMREIGIRRLSHPDDREKSLQNLRDTLDGKQDAYRLEKRYIHKDGHIVWVEINARATKDDDGNTIGAVAIVIDITEQVRIRTALRRSEEKFRSLFEASTVPMYIVDPATMTLLDVNDSACDLYERDRETFLQSKLTDISSSSEEEIRRRLEQTERDGEGEFELIHKKTRSKNDMHLIIQATKVELPDFGPAHFVIIYDITLRKQIERELERSRMILQQKTQQLEVVNRELESFSYSVSHDLRAPLRYIDGFSEMLETDFARQLGERGQDYIDRIRGSVSKMNSLIEAILMLSRATRLEPNRQEINLGNLAQAILNELQTKEPDRRVEVHIADDLVACADPGLMEIALTNLLSNGWKFTRKQDEPVITVGKADIDGTSYYFVSDNGAGFDVEDAEKLFEPFQRFHDEMEFEGHGIGLATVQKIIERHGGQIFAEGEEEKGATFYFSLPDTADS